MDEPNNDLLDEMIADLETDFPPGVSAIDVTYCINYKGKPYKVTLQIDDE